MIAHGLTRCDLYQYGSIGLYAACKSYDESKGAQFQNHAIRCISGTILKESKKDSLGNINNRSNELVERTSMDAILPSKSGDEQITLHDIIKCDEDGFNKVEIESFLLSIKNSLSENVEKVVRLRIEGLTFDEIAMETGVSRQAASQMYKRNKEKIVELFAGV